MLKLFLAVWEMGQLLQRRWTSELNENYMSSSCCCASEKFCIFTCNQELKNDFIKAV